MGSRNAQLTELDKHQADVSTAKFARMPIQLTTSNMLCCSQSKNAGATYEQKKPKSLSGLSRRRRDIANKTCQKEVRVLKDLET